MDKKFEPLFTPWKIRDVEIKNRIVMCPMGGTSLFGWMEPNHFDKVAAEFFIDKAKNNVGLIIPGIAPIRDTIGGRWLYQNKGMFKKLKVFMDEIVPPFGLNVISKFSVVTLNGDVSSTTPTANNPVSSVSGVRSAVSTTSET